MRKKQFIFVLVFVLVTVLGGCGRADVNVENIDSTQSPEPEASKEEEKKDSQEKDTQTEKETVDDNKNQDIKTEAGQEEEKEESQQKTQQPEASANPKKEDGKKTPVSDSSAKNSTENKDKNKNSNKNNSKNKNSNYSKSNNKNKNSKKENSKKSTKDKIKDQIESPDKKETEDPKTVLENALEAVKAVLGDKYKPSAAIDSQWLLNVCGIEKEWYDAMAGEQPMISTNVDTYISIHAANGNAKKIAKALKEYRRYLIEDSMQYPMNQPKVEACKVMTKGDYVFFVMLGALEDDDLEKEEADQKALYEAMNQTALDAIDGVIP